MVRNKEGGLQLGLHERGRYNRVFDVSACQLQSQVSNNIVKTVRRRALELALPVYDLKTHQGLLRFLVIRSAWEGVMVNLVVAEYPHSGVDELVSSLLDEVGQISTAVITFAQGQSPGRRWRGGVCS